MTNTNPLRRRSFLLGSGGVAAGLAIGLPGFAVADRGSRDSAEAILYYRVLLRHTRWAETLWDEAAGHYPLRDFYFLNVLGNAVLVTQGAYDAELAGVSREVLADHTIRTIRHFAATNFWATGSTWGDGGYEWGGRIFWDGTFESYFVAAARLLWDRLDRSTKDNVDAIAVGGAEYVVGLGASEDPRSGGWSSNGLAGGYRGDSKIEEMGAKSMPIATGLAHHPDHPNAGAWREWLTRWTSNMTGLPSVDRDNHTVVDGRPVSEWNSAQNLYEGYVVENHESYAPMYQQSTGAYPGRNAIHFLIAGQPLPEVFLKQPNADGLWRTLTQLGTGAGLSAHPMVNDRYHLYGRDVLPVTWRRMGQGDHHVARSERMLIEHLEPYLAYPPENRLTKFSGEPKYEPEARAEVAMAYLLHTWRDRLHGAVEPVSESRYWANVSGVVDYGPALGMVGHQSARALAIAVSKNNYVKFAFVPEHDDWLFDVTGQAPSFLPATTLAVTGREVATYTSAADGFDASATVLRFAGGFAGFTTLPTGAVVYATSGLAAGEGAFRLHSLSMPGVPGLDGDRTFHGPGGSVTLAANGGDGGVDEVSFPAVSARYVRMLGGRSGSQYGYSLWRFEVFAPGSATDLARGRPTTASSHDPAFPPALATDGDPATRWAVARAERPRPDSWLAVDLGAEHVLDRALLSWDPAYGAEYRVQVSSDGVTWRDAVLVPAAHTFTGGWVNVEDRAGFVVRGGGNPIRVTGTSVTLSDGQAAAVVVEGYPRQRAAKTRALAAVPPSTADVPGVVAAMADGYLSVFNLTGAAVAARVRVPGRSLQPGTQTVTREDHTLHIELDAATAEVLPSVFDLSVRGNDSVRLTATVAGQGSVQLTNDGRQVAVVTLRRRSDGRQRTVPVRPGAREAVQFGR